MNFFALFLNFATLCMQMLKKIMYLNRVEIHNTVLHCIFCLTSEIQSNMQNLRVWFVLLGLLRKSTCFFLLCLAADKDGLNLPILLNLVRKADLSRSEVQILIDLLLNKQHEAPAMDDWSEVRTTFRIFVWAESILSKVHSKSFSVSCLMVKYVWKAFVFHSNVSLATEKQKGYYDFILT